MKLQSWTTSQLRNIVHQAKTPYYISLHLSSFCIDHKPQFTNLALVNGMRPRLLNAASCEFLLVAVCNSIIECVVIAITSSRISQFIHAQFCVFPLCVPLSGSTSDSCIIIATTLDCNRGFRNESHIVGNSHTLSSSECNDGDVSDGARVHGESEEEDAGWRYRQVIWL